MAIGTYEQYKERLLAMKPNVYLNGKKIDRSNGKEGAERDLADWIVGGTYVMKQCYDTANDPEYRDVCVVEEADGSVHNRSTHIHQSVEDLLKKQLMTRLICHRVGGCMQRCMGSDALNALFSVTYDCDQACGTEYHQRLQKYIKYCQEKDLICNCAQTDVKGSRNPKYKRAHQQPDPDQFFHIVETDVDGVDIDGTPTKGIIVRGAKICNSCAPYVDEIIALPTKFMDSEDRDYAVAFALPADWEGIKLMALPGQHHKRHFIDAPFANIGDVESLTIFDDVFVPYSRVFMNGREQEGVCRYAGYLALMFAHFHRHSYTGCKTAVSEVIASQAALVAEVNDIAKQSHVRDKLCDIIQTAELSCATSSRPLSWCLLPASAPPTAARSSPPASRFPMRSSPTPAAASRATTSTTSTRSWLTSPAASAPAFPPRPTSSWRRTTWASCATSTSSGIPHGPRRTPIASCA